MGLCRIDPLTAMSTEATQNSAISPSVSGSAHLELPAFAKATAMALPAIMIGLQLSAWIGFFLLPSAILGRADFRHLYTAGYMVRTGQATKLYDYETEKALQSTLVSPGTIALPFNHLDYEALLFVPFSLVRYPIAYFLFMGFNLALLGIAFRLLLPALENLRRVWFLLPGGVFFGFFPITIALMLGQDSILLLLLFVLAVLAFNRNREFQAGLLVGLGLFKFQIVLPIALLFLIWRRWRFIGGFASSATGVAIVSVLVVGLAQVRVYLSSLLSMSVGLASKADQFRYGISPTSMPNLRGLIFAMTGGRLPIFWVQAITTTASIAVLLWVAVAARERLRGSSTVAFLVAITAACVVSYHMLIHDLTVMLLPLTLILSRFIESEASGDVSGRWVVRLAGLLLVTPSLVFLVTSFYVVSLPLLAFLLVVVTSRAMRAVPENADWQAS